MVDQSKSGECTVVVCLPACYSLISVMFRNEGLFKGLYKGLSVTFIKSPISAAFSFGIYESLI